MATLIQNSAAVKSAAMAIDAAIVAKGGRTVGGLANAAAAIASIPADGLWHPPEDWPDLNAIFNANRSAAHTYNVLFLYLPKTPSITWKAGSNSTNNLRVCTSQDSERFTVTSGAAYEWDSAAAYKWVLISSDSTFRAPGDGQSSYLKAIWSDASSGGTGLQFGNELGRGYGIEYVRGLVGANANAFASWVSLHRMEKCAITSASSGRALFLYQSRVIDSLPETTLDFTAGSISNMFLEGLYNLSHLPMIKAVQNLNFSTAYNIRRDAANEAAFISNLNTVESESGYTVQFSGLYKARFLASEWESFKAAIIAKGWAVTPA